MFEFFYFDVLFDFVDEFDASYQLLDVMAGDVLDHSSLSKPRDRHGERIAVCILL